MNPSTSRAFAGSIWLAMAALVPAHAEESITDAPALPDVLISTSPLPSPTLDRDKVPGAVNGTTAGAIGRSGAAGLNGALSSQLASVNLSDNSGSTFQPDLYYRGFAASPVLGTPQGLAVYQNGVRINEAFGDTVNWDLIPDAAIDRVDVVSANPVYGLNALGGGVAIQMKDGFSWHGFEADASGGSFREHAATAQAGVDSGILAFYGAVRSLDRDGWRRESAEHVRQAYLAASARSRDVRIDLTYTHADNVLAGQGAAPVQELAVDRTLVFTGPQGDRNGLDFTSLSLAWQASPTLALQGVAYERDYLQRVENGNRTDYAPCSPLSGAGLLCQADQQTPLVGPDGQPLADPSVGGSLPLGENDRERIAASGHGVSVQLASTHAIGAWPGVTTIGASLDEARVLFGSSVEVGPVDGQLQVLPTGLYVSTPEGTAFTATAIRLRARHRYFGLYATTTIDFGKRLSVTASARRNDVVIDLEDLAGTALTGRSHFGHLNPALGATWRATSATTLYVNLARNTRTPTASEIECSDPARPCLLPSSLSGDPPTLRQVVADTLEAGVRGKLGDASQGGWQLRWQAGAYRTDLRDDIYGVATGTGTGYFRNIGLTRRQGLDLGLEAVHGSWILNLNVARLDATFETQLSLPSPSNPSADANGDIVVRPGNRLPGLPRDRLRLAITRGEGDRLQAGISIAATGPAYLHGDEGNQLSPLPGFLTIGLHADCRIGAHATVYARIQNLLDRRYSTFGLLGDPTGLGVPGVPDVGADPRFESPAAPRSAFAGVRIRF